MPKENTRIIKVRAWYPNRECFMYTTPESFYWCDAEQVNKFPKDVDSARFLLESQEYTGLLDSKGREIYEGDIVENKTLSMKGVVEFGEHANLLGEYQGWHIKRYLKLGKTKTNSWENPHWEIIGNIYESPPF